MENYLKIIRQSAGLTQSQLAEKSGINRIQISRIERGEIKLENISLANAVAISDVLGVHAEDLIRHAIPMERFTIATAPATAE